MTSKVNIDLSAADIALVVEALGQYVRFYGPDENPRVAADALRRRLSTSREVHCARMTIVQKEEAA